MLILSRNYLGYQVSNKFSLQYKLHYYEQNPTIFPLQTREERNYLPLFEYPPSISINSNSNSNNNNTTTNNSNNNTSNTNSNNVYTNNNNINHSIK